MKNIAIISNGTVANVIVWPANKPLPDDGLDIPVDLPVGIGWTWNGTAFVAPSQPPPPSISPIDQAEAFIATHFSTARLLQMKVWWDTFPHEATPKLAATFLWSDAVTRMAVAGQTDFPDPPHSFTEIAIEATSITEQA